MYPPSLTNSSSMASGGEQQCFLTLWVLAAPCCWANGQCVAAPALYPSSQKLIPLAGMSQEFHKPPRLSVIVLLVLPVPSLPAPPRWPSPFLLSCLSPPENSRKECTETTGALGKITVTFLPPLPSPSSPATLQERSQHLLLLLQFLDAALQKGYLDSLFRILPVDVGAQDTELILENLYL